MNPRSAAAQQSRRPAASSTPSFLGWADHGLVAAARSAGPDIDAALDLARALGPTSESLGRSTWTYLQTLASLGAGDLTVARVVEPHLDALAILGQAAQRDHGVDGSWPSARAPGEAPGACMPRTRPAPTSTPTRWAASGCCPGRKPWCSLADRLTHALITAHVDESRRQRLRRGPGAPGRAGQRRPLGVTGSRRGAQHGPRARRRPRHARWVRRAGTSTAPASPGVAWGWPPCGSAAPARSPRAVLEAARSPRTRPARAAPPRPARPRPARRRARACARPPTASTPARRQVPPVSSWPLAPASTVAGAAELVLAETARALGPAPLTSDEEHARRVADLTRLRPPAPRRA